MGIPDETLRAIVEHGSKAPSGDNCQPWILRREGEELHLVNDEGADDSLYNPANIASFVAHGALIENMAIAARSFGWKAEVKFFPKGDRESLIASIRFREAPEKPEPLYPFIETRCTNRLPYRAVPLPASVKETLLSAVKGEEDGRLYLIEDRKDKKTAAKAACLNDRLLFENRKLHDFLFEHIRWTKKEAETAGDGMDIRTLGLNAVQMRLFRLLKPWWMVTKLNLLGFSRLAPMQSYKLAAGASALGLVQMNGTKPVDYVRGGRALQRVWLTAASLGLSFQPMTGITYLMQRLYLFDGSGFSPEHRRLIEEAETRLKEVFPIRRDRAIIMMFRCGYGPAPAAVSLRKPVGIG